MSEPVEINAAQFFDFVGASGPVVMFLSVHPLHPVNAALHRRIREEHGDGVPFGTAALIDLVVSGSPALPFLRRGLQSCGVSAPVDVLPGYYLFHDGRMLAWDSGLPASSDADAILRGSLLGAVMYVFTEDVAVLGKAVRLAAEEAAAARWMRRFGPVVESCRASGRGSRPPPPPRPPTEDELSRAYRTLGVRPTASDEEVEAAWRSLRVKLHPDLAAGDPVEFQRRSRLAAQINQARDTIRRYRARNVS